MLVPNILYLIILAATPVHQGTSQGHLGNKKNELKLFHDIIFQGRISPGLQGLQI